MMMKEKEAREKFPILMEFDRARHNANKYKKKGHHYGHNKWNREKRAIYKEFKFRNKRGFSELIQAVRFYGLKRELQRKEAHEQVSGLAARMKAYVANVVRKILGKAS